MKVYGYKSNKCKQEVNNTVTLEGQITVHGGTTGQHLTVQYPEGFTMSNTAVVSKLWGSYMINDSGMEEWYWVNGNSMDNSLPDRIYIQLNQNDIEISLSDDRSSLETDDDYKYKIVLMKV